MIAVQNLSLQYDNGKGVFDLDWEIKSGEVVGYLGPNGAGKTTTIRCLMGFMKASMGKAKINNLDCFDDAPQIQKKLGYVPGEIAFVEGLTGAGFIKFMSQMRGETNNKLQKTLLERFELNPNGEIKKFSKGMKQKLGLVVAFMHDPAVLILDEPTSGLDPLMQNRFIELIKEEKSRGKTILMSSHLFEEVEKTSDRVLVIRDGHIVADNSVPKLKAVQKKIFEVNFAKKLTGKQIKELEKDFRIKMLDEKRYEVTIDGNEVENFVKKISKWTIVDLSEKAQTLEEVFLNYYGKQNGKKEA